MTIFTSQLNVQKKPFTFILAMFMVGFLVSPYKSNAQVPGFVGKKIGLSLELPVVPGIGPKDDLEYSKYIDNGNTIPMYHNYKRARIRYRPTIALNIVLNRKSSLQLFGRYYAPMVDIGSFDSTFVDRYGYVSRLTFIPSDRAKMKTTSFGFRYKFFRYTNLSPIGKYFSLGLEYSRINFEFDEAYFTSYSNGDVLTQLPSTTKSNNVYFLAGLGKQYPMTKNLIFNLGLEFALPLNHIKNINSGSDLFNDDVIRAQDWAVNNGSKQNYKHVYFSINIGLTLFP